MQPVGNLVESTFFFVRRTRRRRNGSPFKFLTDIAGNKEPRAGTGGAKVRTVVHRNRRDPCHTLIVDPSPPHGSVLWNVPIIIESRTTHILSRCLSACLLLFGKSHNNLRVLYVIVISHI